MYDVNRGNDYDGSPTRRAKCKLLSDFPRGCMSRQLHNLPHDRSHKSTIPRVTFDLKPTHLIKTSALLKPITFTSITEDTADNSLANFHTPLPRLNWHVLTERTFQGVWGASFYWWNGFFLIECRRIRRGAGRQASARPGAPPYFDWNRVRSVRAFFAQAQCKTGSVGAKTPVSGTTEPGRLILVKTYFTLQC